MEKENTHSTSDLYAAAAVAAILDRVPEAQRNGNGRVVFTFPPDPRVPDILKSYAAHALQVDAYAFARWVRDVKFLVHQV